MSLRVRWREGRVRTTAHGLGPHCSRAPGRAPLAIAAALLAVLGVATGCTTWREVANHPRWTLYAEEPDAIDAEEYRRAYEPAIEAVEAVFGPFRSSVRVHAWDERAPAQARSVGPVHDVPGIGPARVRAFHARGEGPFGPSAGIYAGNADPGTAAHELVHARLAEIEPDLPLWFEEGLACVLGDGFLDGERWVVDGLACWPLRELRERAIDARELAGLLAVRAEADADLRENVLVHFVGWAIVFDLARESGGMAWREWRPRARTMGVAEAHERLRRTIDRETERAWLARLDDEDRGARMATAKGLWKLRSDLVLPALLERLGREEDGEVAVALAINALAAAGERQPSGRMSGRMWRAAWPALKRAELDDPTEQAAVEQLVSSFRWRGDSRSDSALERLRRFWAE